MKLKLEIYDDWHVNLEFEEGISALDSAKAIGLASNMIRVACKETTDSIESAHGAKIADAFFAEVKRHEAAAVESSDIKIHMKDT